MSQRKTVSQKTILKAIKTEPLHAGEGWVAWDSNRMAPLPNKNCEVCAVGAVLRHAGFDNREIDDFGTALADCGTVSPAMLLTDMDAKEVIESLLEEKRFLHALSLKFEDQAIRTGTGKRTRKVLARFVKQNFPQRIKLNVEL